MERTLFSSNLICKRRIIAYLAAMIGCYRSHVNMWCMIIIPMDKFDPGKWNHDIQMCYYAIIIDEPVFENRTPFVECKYINNKYPLPNKCCLYSMSMYQKWIPNIHDDVIKWKHFPRHWPFVRGIHRSPGTSSHKGQWRGALMFSLICV